MKNSIKNLAVMITLISTLNVTALAVPTNGTLQPQQVSLGTIQSQREEVETKIELFDNEIEKNMARTEENKLKISQTEKEIKIGVAEISQVKVQAEKEEELFNSRMRTLYINGLDGYTEILLSADNILDFISRIENIKTIIKYDTDVVDEFKITINQLNEKQQNLSKNINALLGLQSKNKQELAKIILDKQAQKRLISELNNKENILLAALNTSEVEVNRSEVAVNTNIAQVPNTTPSRGATNISQSDLVSYASRFLGTPYLWAGTSPSTGFDCSGFTQYVFRHFGVSIGRTTGAQIRNGIGVSRANLRPGDLVFFGTGNNPHHTGIYVGNNSYIHSPRTGDVIKISPMTRRDYIAGRRVR